MGYTSQSFLNGRLPLERFQPRLLSRMGKKAPLTVERKHRQGGFASEQTPHPSSCPLFLLFPHESLRWIRVGTLPLCNPPENNQGRGDSSSLEPSPLRISEMVESLFSGCHFAFVGVDAHIDPIKITNSPRISVKQHILPGRCGHHPLRLSIEQTLSEFHTSNIQRARTE